MPKEGDIAPAFTLPDQDATMHSLSDYKGRRVLLYFYPKDDTPGCTTEACNFRDAYRGFQDIGLVVLGVSADSIQSHRKFSDKFNLPFPLLSDENKEAVKAYGVWGKKKFMGKEYEGILRTSFLIDEKGIIKKVYQDVNSKVHALEVKEDTK